MFVLLYMWVQRRCR